MRIPLQVARWGIPLLASAVLATLLALTGSASGPGGPVQAAPAAGTTYHCSGYDGCQAAGYSHFGYKAASRNMYWRMYTGHNCTNYVAYRMVRAGMPNTRPWSGGGNASEWGKHMSSITDKTPNVGAVAWWGRYSNGSGSAGHVAYVERVISANQIVVSEDSWGGTFHWRTITRDSGRWPTGFIHFVDKLLAGTGVPVVSGVPTVGATLTATAGKWSGSPSSFTYQWYAGGVAIPGATRAAFVVGAEQRGKALQVQVRATKKGATPVVQASAATAPVSAGEFDVTDAPAVTGDLVTGSTIEVSAPAMTPAPAVTVWKWFVDGVRVPGAATNQFPLTADLVGRSVGVRVVAKQDGYARYASDVHPLGTVMAGVVTVPTEPTVTGSPVVGQPLAVTPPTPTPADATVAYRWLRDGVPIDGATGTAYTVAPADLGARIGVEVSAAKDQFVPWTTIASASAMVTSTPTVAVTTKGRKGRAVVRVAVTAPGAAPVTGSVRIKRGIEIVTVPLLDGVARVVLRSPSGTRAVRVDYLGSPTVPAAPRVRTEVRVR